MYHNLSFISWILSLSPSGWWFQTLFIFQNIWDVILPIDSYFSRWLLHHQPGQLDIEWLIFFKNGTHTFISWIVSLSPFKTPKKNWGAQHFHRRTRIPLDADEPIPEATENTWKSKAPRTAPSSPAINIGILWVDWEVGYPSGKHTKNYGKIHHV